MWHSVFQNVQHICTTLIKSCQILRQFKRTPMILNSTIQIPPNHQLTLKMDVSTGTPLIGRFLGPIENRQSTIYYAGLLGRWDKRIVDQESDVPSIIFFLYFL